MSSVDYLREFVNERLTSAAEEIFGVFKRTIIEYEEELSRQRQLLEVSWKHETQLERTGEAIPITHRLGDSQPKGFNQRASQGSEPPQHNNSIWCHML